MEHKQNSNVVCPGDYVYSRATTPVWKNQAYIDSVANKRKVVQILEINDRAIVLAVALSSRSSLKNVFYRMYAGIKPDHEVFILSNGVVGWTWMSYLRRVPDQ